MNRNTFCVSAATFVAASSGPAFAQSQSIGQILTSHPDFSTFAEWVKASGAQSRLSSAGPYTLFAPLNGAFAQLVPGLTDTMMRPQNRGRLLSVVLYHFLPGSHPLSSFRNQSTNTVRTMNGQLLTVINVNNAVSVNNHVISQHAMTASNGLVYASTAVLVPPMTENMR